jgi:hypothetical protein
VHPRHHRLRHLLHERHQVGARGQQRTDRCQVRLGHVGEVVPGAEHRPVAREHDPERVAVTDFAERGDQLAHVRQRQRVAPLRPVHRDGGELPWPLDQDVLELHGSSLLQIAAYARAGSCPGGRSRAGITSG